METLEIQEATARLRMEWFDEYALGDFLGIFEGLEELFINQQGLQDTTDSWKGIARRHGRLERFEHHQRAVEVDEDSPYYEEEIDLSGLAMLKKLLRGMKNGPTQKPLNSLNIEFVELGCVSGLLVGDSIPADEDGYS